MRIDARKRRPSASLIVAMLAPIVALGGTAVGLPGKNRIDKNDLKKRVVGAKHVKKNAIGSYQLAPSGVGQTQLKPEAVAARAYAEFSSTGVINVNRPNLGIENANVTHPSAGIYCVDGLPFTPRIALGNVDNDPGDNDEILQVTLDDNGDCPGAEQVTVTVEELPNAAGSPNEGDPTSASFYLLIF
jgi:hypothetical protein